MNYLVLSVLAILSVVLAIVAWRSSRESKRLVKRLEAASFELQSLQVAFSRFAPDEVIERIIFRGSNRLR